MAARLAAPRRKLAAAAAGGEHVGTTRSGGGSVLEDRGCCCSTGADDPLAPIIIADTRRTHTARIAAASPLHARRNTSCRLALASTSAPCLLLRHAPLSSRHKAILRPIFLPYSCVAGGPLGTSLCDPQASKMHHHPTINIRCHCLLYSLPHSEAGARVHHLHILSN